MSFSDTLRDQSILHAVFKPDNLSTGYMHVLTKCSVKNIFRPGADRKPRLIWGNDVGLMYWWGLH